MLFIYSCLINNFHSKSTGKCLINRYNSVLLTLFREKQIDFDVEGPVIIYQLCVGGEGGGGAGGGAAGAGQF